MEELRRLEKLQSVVSAVSSRGLLTSDHESSSRFISELVLFLVQPCGDLDIESKLVLVSDFVPKVSKSLIHFCLCCLKSRLCLFRSVA